MLALARATPKRVSRLSSGRLNARSFAEVVGAPSIQGSPSGPPLAVQNQKNTAIPSQENTGRQPTLKDRIPVREDHGLYGFFRRKEGADLVGDAKFEVVETPERMQHATGRGWKASELRLKSFEDLHTLWYILLRERNLLATQKEEARRMGVRDTGSQVSLDRVHQCRKSMARIKVVINERRLAYEGALRLVERQKEQHQDNIVLQHQVSQYRKERKYLQRRRLFMDRKNAERQLLQEAREITAQEKNIAASTSESVDPTVVLEKEKVQEETPISVEPASNDPGIPSERQEAEHATPQNGKNEEEQTLTAKKDKTQNEPRKPPLAQTPSKPIDAAAAGLFGVAQVDKSSRRR